MIGVDGDVVVAWQAHRRTDPDRWGIRRKWTHGMLVGAKQIDRAGFQRGLGAGIGHGAKLFIELVLHILRVTEAPAWEKERFV